MKQRSASNKRIHLRFPQFFDSQNRRVYNKETLVFQKLCSYPQLYTGEQLHHNLGDKGIKHVKGKGRENQVL